jgi:hypothetical protein
VGFDEKQRSEEQGQGGERGGRAAAGGESRGGEAARAVRRGGVGETWVWPVRWPVGEELGFFLMQLAIFGNGP